MSLAKGKSLESVKQAFQYCEQVAKAHYENFPIGSFFIPKEKRKYLYSIYAFARAADDFADENELSAEKRLQQLAAWKRKLEDCYRGHTENAVFIALAETIDKFSVPKDLLYNLLIAFEMDVKKNRYHTWSEVLTYCSYSANPVGRLVLSLFEYKDEKLFQYSDSICTALQLTNFWQDIPIDLKKNRIYIPEEDFRKFSYSEKDLIQQRFNESFQQLLKCEVDRTKGWFEQGEKLISLVGKDLQFELTLTLFGGLRILEKIESLNYNVFRKRPTISLFNKFQLVLKAFGVNSINSIL